MGCIVRIHEKSIEPHRVGSAVGRGGGGSPFKINARGVKSTSPLIDARTSSRKSE